MLGYSRQQAICATVAGLYKCITIHAKSAELQQVWNFGKQIYHYPLGAPHISQQLQPALWEQETDNKQCLPGRSSFLTLRKPQLGSLLDDLPLHFYESWFCYDFTVRHSPKNPAASFTTSRF
ncbi:hypothetical protein SRHO_G00054730 [Serrasalmus rhombeus]